MNTALETCESAKHVTRHMMVVSERAETMLKFNLQIQEVLLALKQDKHEEIHKQMRFNSTVRSQRQ